MNIVSNRPEPKQQAGLEIRQHSGRAAFFSNGKQVPGLIAVVLPTSNEHEIVAAANAGVQMFILRGYDVPFTDDRESLAAFLQAAIAPIHKVAPHCYVILEWNCEPSAEWLQANSHETANCPGLRGQLVSWASQRWLRTAEAVIARLVSAPLNHPLSGVVIGTAVGGWGLVTDPRLRDTGRAMTDRLRLLARDRYRKNVSLLRQAWNEPTLDFHTIRCPRLLERKSETNVVFARAGMTDIALADYWDTVQSSINNAVLSLAGAAKVASPATLVGANCAALHAGSPTPGGVAETLMDSSDIDFFLGPTEGCNAVVRLITGSLGLRGRMMIQQELALTEMGAALVSVHQAGLMVPMGPRTDDWAAALVHMKLPQAKEGSRSCSIAAFIDSASLRTTTQSEAARRVNDAACCDLVRETAMSGLSFDVYHFSDLYRKDFPVHPISLVANLYYLSDSDRQKLEGRLKNRNQTIVWFWGVGLQGESGATAENIARLTGMKVKREESECGLQVRIVSCKDSVINSLKEGDRLGTPLSVSPTFTITDRLAVRAATNSAGKPGMAILRHTSWTSIQVMTPVVTGALIRSIAAAAGFLPLWSGICHDPVLRTTGSRLAVFSNQTSGTLKLVGRDIWVTPKGGELSGAQEIQSCTVFSAFLKAVRT